MLWEGNRQIQEYTNNHIFTTVYDQDSFVPVSRVVQSRDDNCDKLNIYHYHNNHLGTPQELTDDSGNVVWCNYEFAWGGTYDSYYKEQKLNNTTIPAHELQPIKFQGQSLDIETGLHYNRFRYYDSDVGMFIQRDPIGLLGGDNVFAYADNPIMWVDPWGLIKVYRALTTAQGRQAKKGHDIDPKDINANYSMEQHIEDGSLSTQYNSASKKKKIAQRYGKANPHKGKKFSSYIIEIDADLLSPENWYDVSDGINPETKEPFSKKARKYSTKDKEVLIKGKIPKGSYSIISKPKPCTGN